MQYLLIIPLRQSISTKRIKEKLIKTAIKIFTLKQVKRCDDAFIQCFLENLIDE